MARLHELGGISDNPEFLERSFLSAANLRAARTVAAWMKDLGMEVSHAADGTVRGILPGADPEAAPLLLGSHLDTVVDAGKFDGSLGIVTALAALEMLAANETTLSFPVHLLAFSDEEGTRFHSTYLGSRSIVASLDAEALAVKDCSGRSLADILATEGWREGASAICYAGSPVRGYVEVHIEQGRVLEDKGLPACGVSAIAGQSRLAVTITGQADHAGTTPMPQRRDALAGAAECILLAESSAREHPPAVMTVGKLEVHPGAANSIPQTATFTVDLRHPDDAARHRLRESLRDSFNAITARRDLTLDWRVVQESPATACDPGLTARLLDAAESVTGNRFCMASGAGHDGVAISTIAPIAMLFVRCREGLSHHPDEHASPEDISAGIEILTEFLRRLEA